MQHLCINSRTSLTVSWALLVARQNGARPQPGRLAVRKKHADIPFYGAPGPSGIIVSLCIIVWSSFAIESLLGRDLNYRRQFVQAKLAEIHITSLSRSDPGLSSVLTRTQEVNSLSDISLRLHLARNRRFAMRRHTSYR